ncbi:MAG: hypothetical protein R3F07_14555 [Opitutaceae bacterium]
MTTTYRSDRLRRVGTVARVSGFTMMLLGALSLLFSIMSPLTAEFAVSLAILVLGVFEWRLGALLKKGQAEASLRLALNQLAVAGVVTAYSIWKIVVTTDEAVAGLLSRPEIAPTLDLLDPVMRAEVMDRLPGAIRLAYLVIVPVVWMGCGGMAAYYYFKGRKGAAQGASEPS